MTEENGPATLQLMAEVTGYKAVLRLAMAVMTPQQLNLYCQALAESAAELGLEIEKLETTAETPQARDLQIQDAAIQRVYQTTRQQATQACALR